MKLQTALVALALAFTVSVPPTAASRTPVIHDHQESDSTQPGELIHVPLNSIETEQYSRDYAARFAWHNRQQKRMYQRHVLPGIEMAQLRRDGANEESRRRILAERASRENLRNWGDNMYTATVSIGTPPQTFDFNLDTGSSLMYVYDSTCKLKVCIAADAVFHTEKSSTFHDLDQSLNVTYYQNLSYASGPMGSDSVSMGGIAVENQVFVRVSTTDDSFSNMKNVSGLMGLSWGSTQYGGTTPYWLSAMTQWQHPMFAMYLARYNSSTKVDILGNLVPSTGGQLTLGGVDRRLYTGRITYIPLQTPDFWRIPLDSLTINGQVVSTGLQNSSVIDTGTAQILGPPGLVAEFYKAIPGAKPYSPPSYGGMTAYTFPCAAAANASISLEFGGQSFAMNYTDFTDVSNSSATCWGSIWASPDGATDFQSGTVHWVIGVPFLRNVYAVYRAEPPAVGFATLGRRITSVSDADNDDWSDDQQTTPMPSSAPAPSNVPSRKTGSGLKSRKPTSTSLVVALVALGLVYHA